MESCRPRPNHDLCEKANDCLGSHGGGRNDSAGRAGTDGDEDPRWQAVIQISDFVPAEPEAVWPFVLRWGSHEDEDLRAAVATCLLEHLLEHHFDLIFSRVVAASKSNTNFAKTTAQCWKFGDAKHPERAKRLDQLRAEIRKSRS
jgi:hypothetical protein